MAESENDRDGKEGISEGVEGESEETEESEGVRRASSLEETVGRRGKSTCPSFERRGKGC